MSSATGRRVLEIAVESASDVRSAVAAGADRFELCAALEIGGLTPSMGTLMCVRGVTDRPVLVMLRPRGGGFVYSDDEFRAIRADAERLLAAGADGIVVGCLRADGTIDAPRMRESIRDSGPRPLVFHRAFDLTPDPFAALECLIDLGVTRVLTSGGCVRAVEPAARGRLRELIIAAAGRIEVIAGSGIRSGNAAGLIADTGCTQVHSSCRAHGSDESELGRRAAAMGFGVRTAAGLQVAAFDAHEVRALRVAIDEA